MDKLASASMGKRLFKARKESGLTMAQLADKSGVGTSTVNQIEKSYQVPGADTIERLARALGVDPCWLAYGSGTKPEWETRKG